MQDVAAIAGSFIIRSIECKRRIISRERVLRPAKSLQRYPFVVKRLRVTAPISRGEVIGSERVFETPELLKDIASIEFRFCIWRTAPGGFFIGRESLFVASELLQHGAFIEQIRTIIRSYRIYRIEACEGFVKTPKSFKQGTTNSSTLHNERGSSATHPRKLQEHRPYVQGSAR